MDLGDWISFLFISLHFDFLKIDFLQEEHFYHPSLYSQIVFKIEFLLMSHNFSHQIEECSRNRTYFIIQQTTLIREKESKFNHPVELNPLFFSVHSIIY